VGLILHTAAIATRGEVYVLDMGKPILITDLARMLIRLAGFDPNDVPIRYTGLRPGERLHEALFFSEEIVDGTSHPGIFRVRPSGPDEEATTTAAPLADRIETAARERDDQEVRRLLAQVGGANAAPISSSPDVREPRTDAPEPGALRHA
jgi:FlaA1/EpsC-like NDP-sugar epimerase